MRPTHRSRRRLSPSLILATAALVAASGGTAIAAGELITRADQIAPGVIDGDHIRPHSVAKGDLQHPTLRLRVTSNGALFGDPSDATAKRDSLGVYVVTFNRDAIDGGSRRAEEPALARRLRRHGDARPDRRLLRRHRAGRHADHQADGDLGGRSHRHRARLRARPLRAARPRLRHRRDLLKPAAPTATPPAIRHRISSGGNRFDSPDIPANQRFSRSPSP